MVMIDEILSTYIGVMHRYNRMKGEWEAERQKLIISVFIKIIYLYILRMKNEKSVYI